MLSALFFYKQVNQLLPHGYCRLHSVVWCGFPSLDCQWLGVSCSSKVAGSMYIACFAVSINDVTLQGRRFGRVNG